MAKQILFPGRAATSLVLIAVLLLVGGATWEANRDAGTARQLARHSLFVLGAIKDLNLAVTEAETGQRGYLLTGEDTYLAPYDNAVGRVTPLLDNLRTMTADNPAAQDRLATLTPLLQRKLGELAATVRMNRDLGAAPALHLVKTGLGKNLMTQIGATLAAMADDEQTLFASRVAQIDGRNALVTGLTLSGALIAVLTLFWSVWVLHAAATTDTLTGLLCRNRMSQLLDARGRAAKPRMAALLSLDLDRFRSVNQVFGPTIGDQLLVEVGRRLSQVARKFYVGCVGSDDFSIYCVGSSRAEAEKLGTAATQTLARPFEVEGHSFHLTASVGVAHSETALDLDLRQGADDAMHVAKRQGGNQVVAFERSMHDERKELSELEQDLHGALEGGDELFMAYQPVVRIADGALVAIEALARWNHPRLGAIPPGRFIELAETRGLMPPLGLKLADMAIRQVAAWHAQYPGSCPVININVSPIQFSAGDVVADLVKLLRQHGMDASTVCIEVTEGAFANGEAIQALQVARRLGFKVSMDDFGVGYSSLAQLPRLPLTSVKLDRSFIVNAERAGDKAMLAAIVELAHALMLDVVAEGVESQAQLDLVSECGCDAVQGYFYSSPRKPEALDKWLSGVTSPAARSGGRAMRA